MSIATTDEAGEELSLAEQPDTLALRTGRPIRKRTLRVVRPDGTHRWLEVDAVPVFGPNGRLTQVVSSYVDVTTRKQAEDALEHQAIHDTLTGLPNRTLLLDRVAQAVLASRRQHTPFALLVMNLDGFKEVNDGFGYQGGDAVLQEIAERLKSVLRASDTVARIGGDEFGLLLPVVDMDGAAVVAGKVLRLLDEPVVVQGQAIDLHASLGIALCPEHGDEGETLLRRADVAMQVAKFDGSGYTVYTFEQEQHTTGRLALASDLRRAIEQDQLVLYYQPKVDYRSNHVTSVEALVRWRYPELGVMPPDEFITLAEKTGLIVPLTRWVLNAALRQCREWQLADLASRVAVNLSMRNLQDPQLLDTVTSALNAWHVAPLSLTVELTETAFIVDPDRAMEVLTQLSSMGVRIAIDDFGTGYSSLGYLKRLPVHKIKIDKSFVMNMMDAKNDFTIVRSTIDLGHNLGLRVIAEGVEDQATWNLLGCLGCDSAQGYYLGRPLPVADFVLRLIDSPWPPRTLASAKSTLSLLA